MKENHAISPTGWWMAGLLERHEQSSRAMYWNNYRLIRATHWREAWQKALALGHRDSEIGRQAFSGSTEFLGITDLVPVYDAFEDGAELLWKEYGAGEDGTDDGPPEIFTEAELAAIYEPTAEADDEPPSPPS